MSDTLFHLCSTKSGVETDKRTKKTLGFLFCILLFLDWSLWNPTTIKKKRKNLMKDVFGLEEVLCKSHQGPSERKVGSHTLSWCDMTSADLHGDGSREEKRRERLRGFLKSVFKGQRPAGVPSGGTIHQPAAVIPSTPKGTTSAEDGQRKSAS